MPRQPRYHPAGICFHVLNRGNNRRKLFEKPGDYAAFASVLSEALGKFKVELLCWCFMPNHWHLVLRPGTDKAMSEFMRWLTVTHVRRRHHHHPSQSGHLYQGRYKSFAVEEDDYFLTLCRYVEANPLRAKLVDRAQDWKWSSLYQRMHRAAEPKLADWPLDRPDRWTAVVNDVVEGPQVENIRQSIARDRPLGSENWLKSVARRLKLQHKLRPRGRPSKPESQLSIRQKQRRRKQVSATEAT